MKRILSYFLFSVIFLLSMNSTNAQVEVRSTSPNSVLAVNSPDKGILLPRVNSTSLVNSPEEGLFVYDKATKSPSYHDGVQWNKMMAPPPSAVGEDSLTYTVLTAYGPPFSTGGPYPLADFSIAGSSGGFASVVNFTKPFDVKTTGFLSLFHDGYNGNTLSIEVKVYVSGQSTPYFGYKLTDIEIVSMSMQNSQGNLNSQGELYTLVPNIIGYKNFTTNFSFARNQTTGANVSY